MTYLGHMTTQPQGIVPTFTMQDRLRKARELTGLSQARFAEELGVVRATVSNAETGATSTLPSIIKSWALRTGVPLEWLLTGDPGHPSGGGQPTEPYADVAYPPLTFAGVA